MFQADMSYYSAVRCVTHLYVREFYSAFFDQPSISGSNNYLNCTNNLERISLILHLQYFHLNSN